MNKKFAKKWVTKLLSGEYEQGSGALAKKSSAQTKFCCLGIACLVGGLKYEQNDKTGILTFSGEKHYLPKEVCKLAGLDECGTTSILTENWGQNECPRYCTLSQLNDYGFTFPQIADVIRYEAGV